MQWKIKLTLDITNIKFQKQLFQAKPRGPRPKAVINQAEQSLVGNADTQLQWQ